MESANRPVGILEQVVTDLDHQAVAQGRTLAGYTAHLGSFRTSDALVGILGEPSSVRPVVPGWGSRWHLDPVEEALRVA
jgi:hypothetical protein